MDERMIFEAFDAVQADEALKARTVAAVTQELSARRRTAHPVRRWAAAATCALVILGGLGGYQVYATPTATVRIDLPETVELEVNRFGRVVSATGTEADIYHQTYDEALTAIFAECPMENVAVAVDGDPGQCAAISDAVERCSGGKAYCHGWGNAADDGSSADGTYDDSGTTGGHNNGHNGGGQQHRHGQDW
ncbi:hypothetical protein ACTQ33_09775 [Candidatus Avoscillospira sp. LCP25S3_F1]|uniref:hypothetical protein n=1 Tax=Candidatus Avoscillospira sp. LCP25S3_F1 TaxID=3438825 RepID=UPI003F8E638D